MFGIVEEMGQTVLPAIVIEVLGEVTAVVRLDSPCSRRSHLKELPQEIMATGGRVRLVGVSESKPGADIDGSEDMALEPGGEYGHRVHLHKVAWLLRQEALASFSSSGALDPLSAEPQCGR